MDDDESAVRARDPVEDARLHRPSAVGRRHGQTTRLTRVVAAGLMSAVAGVALVWFSGRPQGQSSRNQVALRVRQPEFKLPPLQMDLPRAAERVLTMAHESTDSSVPDEAGGLDRARTAPVSVPAVTQAADRVQAKLPEVAEPNPVLWRKPAESVAALPRDTSVGEPDGRLTVGGYAPVRAQRLPPSTWVLPKGSMLQCALETAIDSQFSGLVTCVTSAGVYGSDGRELLMKRGTRLIGESRNEARTGQSRVYVIWIEARTPDGLLVPLASPATDALGRAGLPGAVDTHFLDRFGAAMLISVLNAGVSGVASRGGGSPVIVAPQGPETVVTEVLRNTVSIPPTIRVAPGTLVTVLVARDIDFGESMKTVDGRSGAEGSDG